MRELITSLWIFWLVIFQVNGQPEDSFTTFEKIVFQREPPSLTSLFLATNQDMTQKEAERIEAMLNSFEEELIEKRKSIKSDINFVRFLRQKAYKKFLKEYETHSLFGKTMQEGKYDCLSATIFMSFFLEKFNIPYTAYETTNHVFLTVNLPKDTLLIEPTDPEKGFYYRYSEVKGKMREYKEKAKQENQETRYYKLGAIFQLVSLEGLAGLQYYNLAIQQFNQFQYQEAKASIGKSLRFYQGARNYKLLELTNSILRQQANLQAELGR